MQCAGVAKWKLAGLLLGPYAVMMLSMPLPWLVTGMTGTRFNVTTEGWREAFDIGSTVGIRNGEKSVQYTLRNRVRVYDDDRVIYESAPNMIGAGVDWELLTREHRALGFWMGVFGLGFFVLQLLIGAPLVTHNWSDVSSVYEGDWLRTCSSPEQRTAPRVTNHDLKTALYYVVLPWLLTCSFLILPCWWDAYYASAEIWKPSFNANIQTYREFHAFSLHAGVVWILFLNLLAGAAAMELHHRAI